MNSRGSGVRQILQPLRDFLRNNAAGAVLLFGATVLALAWSNSPLADSYDALWHTELGIGVGELVLSLTYQEWVNDALMALFFLVVGLEIKRELLVGELADRQRAILPAAAAVGGAVLPAVIFLAVVGPASPVARGWGVPMATDIAFALGVLVVLGRRIPLGLRIFVAALAIVDDLLAVLVIALFYTADISPVALVASAGLVVLLVLANRLGLRQPAIYLALGVLLWVAVHESGVHATIAGVLLALTIPAGRRGSTADPDESSPMIRIEHALTPLVTFAIVPVFALANAGVTLGGDVFDIARDPLVIAIVAGLVIGKQIGITAAAWLVVRMGLAALPSGVSWRHIYGAAWVCGIGFTMSLFIANLAYGDSNTLDVSKLGILGGSLIAGLGGFVLLWRLRATPATD